MGAQGQQHLKRHMHAPSAKPWEQCQSSVFKHQGSPFLSTKPGSKPQ